ncbi:hypothetical protein [Pedobacter heparinus]|uniref:hypothetical protein n=1 Tax=Pedobacter heparinus TaxID=984 RepID=UPI00292EEB20|nr:hypothetical protein [Pedobacter heparinus]
MIRDLNIKYWGMNLINLVNEVKKEHRLFGLLLFLWLAIPELIKWIDQTAGYIDQSIWLLIVLSLICFLMVVGLCWWLLNRFWMSLGLPELGELVLDFREMKLCVQLGFYFGAFALLLLAAVGVLGAVV